MAHGGHPETPMEFGVRMIAAVDDLRLAWHEVSKCIGPEWRNLLRKKSNNKSNNNNNNNNNNNRHSHNNNKNGSGAGNSAGGQNSTTSAKSAGICGGCGREMSSNHNKGNCAFKSHPDFNSANVPFNQSDAYKKLQANGNRTMLNGKFRADGTPLENPIVTHSAAMQHKNKGGRDDAYSSHNKKPRGGESIAFNAVEHIAALSDESDDFDDSELYTVPCNIINCKPAFTVHVLLDTGALQANYVNKDIADSILSGQNVWSASRGQAQGCLCSSSKLGNKNSSYTGDSCHCMHNESAKVSGDSIYARGKNTVVCSAFTGNCNNVHGTLTFTLGVYNELINDIENIEISAFIINTPYDVILGRPDVISLGLLYKCASHFSDSYEARVKNHFLVQKIVKAGLSAANGNTEYNLGACDNNSSLKGNSVANSVDRDGVASVKNHYTKVRGAALAVAQLLSCSLVMRSLWIVEFFCLLTAIVQSKYLCLNGQVKCC